MDSDGEAVISEEEKERVDEEKEDSQKEEKPNFEVRTRKDARAVLSWQQNRYQHLQSLSRGLFGTLIAMLAILISVSVAFSNRLRPIPTEIDSALRTAASSTPVGPTGALLTILLNGLILYTLLALAAYSFVVAALRLYDIFTERSLLLNLILHSTADQGNEDNGGESLKILRRNRDELNATYARFTEGAFRILMFTSLVMLMSIIYYFSTRLHLTNLLANNILFIMPGSVLIKFGLRIFIGGDVTSSAENAESMTFAEEFLQEDKGRWSHVEFHRIENILFTTSIGISLVVVLIWVLSALL